MQEFEYSLLVKLIGGAIKCWLLRTGGYDEFSFCVRLGQPSVYIQGKRACMNYVFLLVFFYSEVSAQATPSVFNTTIPEQFRLFYN